MTTDYTKLEGADLLHEMGTDASKWAAAFCQLQPTIDEDTMLGWFANAIQHALDTERGTVINGEHAQYLVENGLTPNGRAAEAVARLSGLYA